MISLTGFNTLSLHVPRPGLQGNALPDLMPGLLSITCSIPEGQLVVFNFYVLPTTRKNLTQGPAQMPPSGVSLFTLCVRIIYVSVFSQQWAPFGQGTGLIQAVLFRPSTGEVCLMVTVMPCLSWLLSLPAWHWSWTWLSFPLSLLNLLPVEGDSGRQNPL